MNRRYRLLITVNEFMHSSKTRNLCDLVEGLDREIFEIEIGTLSTGDEATSRIDALGVPYYRLRLEPPRSLRWWRFADFIKAPYIMIRKRFDLVHSLNYSCFFTEPLFVKAFGRARYVYTKSNTRWDNHPLMWRMKSHLSDRIISISRSTDDQLRAKGFGNKIAKIFLGIDTNRFQLSQSHRREMRLKLGFHEEFVLFGCAAQFVEWKQQMVLISAFEEVARTHSNVVLVLCGPHHNDDYYSTVLRRIASSPYRNRIVMLGTLSDMPEFYSTIDCFILPSRREPFGYVYIEAMACSRPVIACRAAGPLDIVAEGQTGLFCDIGDVHSLVESMEHYLEQPEDLKDHGRQARARAIQLFSKEVMVQKHQELYLELVKE